MANSMNPTPNPTTKPDAPELPVWRCTDDVPKAASVWIRSIGDYREHLIVGFAHPVAVILASCGCEPIVYSAHFDNESCWERTEYSLDRKTWHPCRITPTAPSVASEKEVKLTRFDLICECLDSPMNPHGYCAYCGRSHRSWIKAQQHTQSPAKPAVEGAAQTEGGR